MIIWAFSRCSINNRQCCVRFIRGTDIVERIIISVRRLAELSCYINFCFIQHHSWATISIIFISMPIFITIYESRTNIERLLNICWGWLHYPLFNYFIRWLYRNLTKTFLLISFSPTNRVIIADCYGPLAHRISDTAFTDLSDSIGLLWHAA